MNLNDSVTQGKRVCHLMEAYTESFIKGSGFFFLNVLLELLGEDQALGLVHANQALYR